MEASSNERLAAGHAENRRSFNAVLELFLAEHLGGRAEPVGDDFAGSSIEFKAGRELISSLATTPSQPRTPVMRHDR